LKAIVRLILTEECELYIPVNILLLFTFDHQVCDLPARGNSTLPVRQLATRWTVHLLDFT